MNENSLQQLESSGWRFSISDDLIVFTSPKGEISRLSRLPGAQKGKLKLPVHLKGLFLEEYNIVNWMWPWSRQDEILRWVMAKEKMQETIELVKEKERLYEELRTVSSTEINSKSTIRKYQDRLRSILLKERGACELSGVCDANLLVVSHIKPWADCGDNAAERLDAENVLLLACNWDALFDKKYISFDPETGLMIKSSRIDEEVLFKFGVPKNWRETIRVPVKTEARRNYLQWHVTKMRSLDCEYDKSGVRA